MPLRDTFRGFYSPEIGELDELWNHGAIILDTAVLLNLYKYPVAAREDMLAVLETVRDRLWIPHHVALEYHRRRETVIRAQLAVFDKVKAIVGFERIKSQLDALQLRKFHSLISVDSVLQEIRPALERFEAELSTLEDEHVKPTGADSLLERLQTLIGENIGAAFSSEDLWDIYQEGSDRYSRQIPPGYLDEKEKAKQPDFVHGGLTYRPMFGDLILWKEIIRHVKDRAITHVILVSDDEKADWRQVHEYRGRRVLLPRPELVDEVRREGGVDVFFIYSSESFLTAAKERLGVTISDNTIPQVTDVKAAALSSEDPRWNDSKLSLIQIIGEEGNRRDAVLYCGHCNTEDIQIHFYEGQGVPKLMDVLGIFHYWHCPASADLPAINFMIMRDNKEPTVATWIRAAKGT